MVNNENCCLAKILKVIEILQKNVNNDCCEEGCSKPFLGPTANEICYNTRPINLYGRNGELFTVNFTNDKGKDKTSSVFRVEKVNGCCCKLRILEKKEKTNTYIATNHFINVNLRCMCSVSCLDDLALENIC